MRLLTSAERFLEHLTGELEPVRDLVLRFLDRGSCIDAASGALCVSHRPGIAPEAGALRLFHAVGDRVISTYEQIHSITICPEYRSVLKRMNGAFLFEISLFGLPPSMCRVPPLLDRSTAWPLDLGSAQRNWAREYNVVGKSGKADGKADSLNWASL